MTEVGAYEAKTHLPKLLAAVENGECVTITRHGRPIARLVPVGADQSRADVAAQLRRLRATTDPGEPIAQLVREGRR